MIIFDLDGTLADCEHRRHFVDISKYKCPYHDQDHSCICCVECNWKPDYKSFYEACDKDRRIESVISIWNDQISLGAIGNHMIWSGRCESVREKTEKWLDQNLLCFEPHQLKMRPIGDSTPADVLKKKWLRQVLADNKRVDFVFEDDPKCIRMYRSYGIYVFNCSQEEEF